MLALFRDCIPRLTFVMVQFSATKPTHPDLFYGLDKTPCCLTRWECFTATFLYALVALAWVDRNGSGRVPLIGIVTVTVLLVLSVIMFIGLHPTCEYAPGHTDVGFYR